MRTKLFLTTLTLLFVFLFFSCQDSIVEQRPEKQNSSKSHLLLKQSNSNIINKTKLLPPKYGHNTDTTNTLNGVKAPDCSVKYVYGWAIKKYAPKNDKITGIWANQSPITWAQYHDKYGFSSVVVSNLTAYNAAKNAGYLDNNLAVSITSPSTATSQINSMNNAKYFFIDEPFEKGTFSTSNILSIASFLSSVNSSSKLLLISYKWPTWLWHPTTTYGEKYKYILNNRSNAYITCDEYHGNIFGTVSEYWQKYSNYYGYNKHIADWMHINYNSPYTGDGDGFSTLFSKANSLGIKKIWLFAGSNTNPTSSKVNHFCYAAWNNLWLRGYAQNYILVYRCDEPNPCINCDENSYYLDDIIWYGNLYEVYP